jgi:hypothetical protein
LWCRPLVFWLDLLVRRTFLGRPIEEPCPYLWLKEIKRRGSSAAPARRAGAAAAVGFAGIAAYQVALALGAPFGTAAWGGAHPGTLPPRFRVASGVGAALWGFAALIILQRVGLSSVLPFGRTFVRRATWVLVVLSCMSAVANFASQSAAERFILAPVAIALAVLCFIVARRTTVDLP